MEIKPNNSQKKEVCDVNLASNFFVVLQEPLQSCFGAGPSFTFLNIWSCQEPALAAVYRLREDWTEKIHLKDSKFGEACPQYIVLSTHVCGRALPSLGPPPRRRVQVCVRAECRAGAKTPAAARPTQSSCCLRTCRASLGKKLKPTVGYNLCGL